MSRSIAIVLAGGLVAAAIILTNRWQIVVGPVQNLPNPQVYRLDRLTGKVASCSVVNPHATLEGGIDTSCDRPEWSSQP